MIFVTRYFFIHVLITSALSPEIKGCQGIHEEQDTHALPAVIVTVHVEHRQHEDIHGVQQTGHLRVTSVGGYGLNTKNIAVSEITTNHVT